MTFIARVHMAAYDWRNLLCDPTANSYPAMTLIREYMARAPRYGAAGIARTRNPDYASRDFQGDRVTESMISEPDLADPRHSAQLWAWGTLPLLSPIVAFAEHLNADGRSLETPQ
ncbi:MAG: hypothetical protein ACRC2U_01885 [Aeromonas sp.]